MSEEEPTDAQLSALMQGIGFEANQKALIAEKKLKERIQQEMEKAQAWYEVKG